MITEASEEKGNEFLMVLMLVVTTKDENVSSRVSKRVESIAEARGVASVGQNKQAYKILQKIKRP